MSIIQTKDELAFKTVNQPKFLSALADVKQPSSTPDFLKTRIRPWELISAFGAVIGVATILGFFGRLWWFFDLFSHFRVQFFFALTAGAVVLLFPRRCKVAAVFGVMATVNLATIMPLYLGGIPEPIQASSPLRAILVNVNTESGRPDLVAQLIRQSQADIVVLEEVNDQWLSALSKPLRTYEHSKAFPRGDNFGIAVFSKYRFVQSDLLEIGEAEVPSIIAEVASPGGRFTLIATHPLPPASAENSWLRNDQLARLPEVVKQARTPVLLLGDLNVTPWSSHFKRLLRQSGLRDSSQGRGPLATWPTFLPILRIPIDHCLHSPEIQVIRKEIGPNVGSDHFPLVVDFALTSAP